MEVRWSSDIHFIVYIVTKPMIIKLNTQTMLKIDDYCAKFTDHIVPKKTVLQNVANQLKEIFLP